MAEPVPGSPEWWLVTLFKALDDRATSVRACDDYYCGRHPLPAANPGSVASAEDNARRAWRRLAESGITNWCSLVADAPAERLTVIGFRFGEETSGDQDAWKLWQGNQLDADSDLVHGTGLQTGQSFALVWPNPMSPVGVDITLEHPEQTIVAYAAGSRRNRVAGLKRWVDDDGKVSATVYLPAALYKYQSIKKADQTRATSLAQFAAEWVARAAPDELWPLPNPLGVVPLIEFRANPSLAPSRFGGGEAEFAKVISIQDRINKTIFDRMVTAEHQAFRQRYVIGWDFPTNDQGQPDRTAMLKAAASRLWTFQGEDGSPVSVGELGQADFTPFVKAIESDVQAMAAISKTPPHYLLGQMVNVSGDAVTAAEAGLIAKCGRHARNFGESWEEVMRLALRAVGDPRADDVMSMIQWGDMESRTWGETVDAVLKMQALGVPAEALWLKLPGVTPQDVDRWKQMQGADTLRRSLLEPEPGDEQVDETAV